VESLKLFGQIAGIGGLTVGVLLVLYRDLLRKLEVPGLNPRQWYRVVVLFMLLVSSIAAFGIVAWTWSSTQVTNAKSSVNGPVSSEPTLAGEWNLLVTIEESSYRPFQNLRVGYRLFVSQHGDEITGEAEKTSENTQSIPSSARSAMHLRGSISGKHVYATFILEGSLRKTTGQFEWSLSDDGNALQGRFVSTGAESRGSAFATRIQ